MKTFGLIVLALFTLIAVLLLFVWYRLNNVSDQKNLEASVAKLALKHLQEEKAYGLVVGIYKDDKMYIQGFGSVEKGKRVLPDSNTIFELASVSKLFTTSTLQILADAGTLKLDDTAASLLASKVQVASAAKQTTLRHLATHLSGFPSLPNSFLAKMTDEQNPYKDLSTQDLYDYLKTCEGKQPEGAFEYSNLGMGLLGHLLELNTQTPYEALVKQKLLLPLGMNHSFVTLDATHRAHLAQGYDETGRPTPVWTDNVLTGAGSFLSDASDMLKFIKANLRQDASGISASLLRTHTQQLGGETGLGWILPSSTDKLMGNGDLVWHNGMAGGYASFVAVDRPNQYGLVVLSNKAEDVTALGMKLARLVKTQSWKP